MKIHEAAAEAHLHPCELVLELARIGAGSFDGDIFPETNDGYVATLMQMKARPRSGPDLEAPASPADPPLSAEAQQILRALRHKKHWGTNVAAKEQIIRHYCKGLPDYDRPLKELCQAGLLLCRGSPGQGPYALNPRAKARIERVLGPDQPVA